MDDYFNVNEYGGDYDYDNDDKGEDYQMEATAFERVGVSGKLSELLSTTDEKGKENETPEDRFLKAVDAISRGINSEGVIQISQEDINVMLEKTTGISNVKHKNATCYVLGYLASEGGKSLNPEKVSLVINKILPNIDKSSGIEPEDVIRYARFWYINL
jgi:hypothetical protein